LKKRFRVACLYRVHEPKHGVHITLDATRPHNGTVDAGCAEHSLLWFAACVDKLGVRQIFMRHFILIAGVYGLTIKVDDKKGR
jgi:hypothetical protein